MAKRRQQVGVGGHGAISLAVLLYGTMTAITLALWLLYAANQASVLAYAHERDFLNPYIGARLLLEGHGGQLYNIALQAAVSKAAVAPYPPGQLQFLYPPYTALLLAPFGLIPYAAAFVLWGGLNLVAAAYSVQALLAFARPRPAERLPLLLAVLGFAPLFHTLWQGQISIIVLLSLTGAALALRAGREAHAGAWLILGLIKPQLIAVPLLALVVMRRWRALLVFATGAALLHGLTLVLCGN